MAKSREYRSLYPENPPEWYWISGLHDAGFVGVESFEFATKNALLSTDKGAFFE